MKERKINSEFEYDSPKEGKLILKVVEGSNSCQGCYFDEGIHCGMNIVRIMGPCIRQSRSDYRDVIAVKVYGKE